MLLNPSKTKLFSESNIRTNCVLLAESIDDVTILALSFDSAIDD